MKTEFVKFLKSKRLWSKFKREWNNLGQDETVNDYLGYLEDMDDKSYISLMDVRISGFWVGIHILWQKHLKKLK